MLSGKPGQWLSVNLLDVRATPYPNMVRLNDNESPRKLVSALDDQMHHGLGQPGSGSRGPADEDDAHALPPSRKHKLTKVLVLGKEYPVLSDSDSNNIFIRSPRGDLRDCGHIVVDRPESPHDAEVATLICQKSHSVNASDGRAAAPQRASLRAR